MIESKYVWMDGKMIPFENANVHLLSHTLHYGLGAFEGVRSYISHDKKSVNIFRLKEHTERLFKSASTVNMKIPFSVENINQAHIKVIQANNLDEAYIRPMCFYGSEGMGLRADNLNVHTMVAAWEWPSYMDPEAREKGIKVKLSTYKRQVKNPVSNAKVNGNYVHSIVALTEALEDGFDEALMLDADGYVAEGSGENFIIVKDGKLYSPFLDSCLDGITRKTIIDLAMELKIPFQEKKITVEDVFDADESFFSGTAAEVVPINSLDNQKIGNGLRGPVTEKLQKTYFDQVRGEREANNGWHTFTN